MAKGNQGIALRHLDTLFRVGTVGGLTDAQLLERFSSRRDETSELAFAALVDRHGPMVLRVCRAVLRDSHEAHDAFQATFLVLVRKAGSLWVRDSLGPWLHQVALRTAACARSASTRRRRHERRAAASAARSAHEADRDVLGSVVHEEVERLPERYRAAVVLCLLEGLTPDQAARHLGWPVGTVHSRLARGRERLKVRLIRRGLATTVAALGALQGAKSGSAAMPAGLGDATVQSALKYAAIQVTAGAVPASVDALTGKVLRTMCLTKSKWAAAIVFTGTVIAAGAGGLAYQAGRAPRTAPEEASKQDGWRRILEEEQQRALSVSNLKSLALALHNFHDRNDFFPPAAIRDSKTGKPLLSWRVSLLPAIGAEDLYKQFHLDEPWDSPHNKTLRARMPAVYAPVRGKTKEPYSTFYQVFVGPGTAFEPPGGSREGSGMMEAMMSDLLGPPAPPKPLDKISLLDITDGTANTIAIVEAGEAVPWTKPEDLPYDPKRPLPQLGGLFGDGFHVLFVYGTVRFVKKLPDKKALDDLLRNVITRNGGEPFDWQNRLP